jgi:hypothetical protein
VGGIGRAVAVDVGSGLGVRVGVLGVRLGVMTFALAVIVAKMRLAIVVSVAGLFLVGWRTVGVGSRPHAEVKRAKVQRLAQSHRVPIRRSGALFPVNFLSSENVLLFQT